jgi:hypothetical protein
MHTTTCTILVLICITAIINQAYPHPRNKKALTDRQTIGATCQQDKTRSRTNSPKGRTKAQQSFNVSYSLFASHFNNAKALVNKLWYSTLTTHKFFSKLTVVNKRWKKPPTTLNNKNPNMSTRQQKERSCLQSEKKTAEATLKLQMEKGQLKRLEEKKKREAERKQEEDLWKIAKAEQRKLHASMIEEAMVVSPPSLEEDRADPSINSHLMDMMQGSSEEGAAEDEGDKQRSPVKSKQKKITFTEATSAKPVLKPAIKSPNPAIEAHKHTHPRTIVDASIKLTGSTPVPSARLHCAPSRASKERSDGG